MPAVFREHWRRLGSRGFSELCPACLQNLLEIFFIFLRRSLASIRALPCMSTSGWLSLPKSCLKTRGLPFAQQQ